MAGATRNWLWSCLLSAAVLAACTSVPYTRRSQLILVPESQEVSLGESAYREVLAKATLLTDARGLDVVQRVGERIAAAAGRGDYQWEFAVIDDDSMVNAFALPGGKVAVYTGLFPVAQDEAGLAAVVGHEVGHVLAHHAAERISHGLLLQAGAVGLSIALGQSSPATRELVMQAFGLGAELGFVRPFSRSQESEADHIGLILMAKAGYEPGAALELWQRMAQVNERVPPELLSTHPSYGTRQAQIRKWLPEARSYYRPVAGAAIAKLPDLAELESAPGVASAALGRYARNIDRKAQTPFGQQTVRSAIAAAFDISVAEVDARRAAAKLSLGETAVASAIALAARRPFAAVVGEYRRGHSWSAIVQEDEAIVRAALERLRLVMVRARERQKRG